MKKLMILTAVAAVGVVPAGWRAQASDQSNTDSQLVECNQVDRFLSFIPHGNGNGIVTEGELGPGGWRYNGGGQSFVTFAHELTMAGDGYVVDAGRSNVGANTGIINDYPEAPDLPQDPSNEVLFFKGRKGTIILTGDTSNDPPLFALPGAGEGAVRINLHDPEGDGTFEGCAQSPLLKNFGFVRPEGGDFVQQEYFKAYAETDSDGMVTFYEFTEVSTFKNTESDGV